MSDYREGLEICTRNSVPVIRKCDPFQKWLVQKSLNPFLEQTFLEHGRPRYLLAAVNSSLCIQWSFTLFSISKIFRKFFWVARV
ncbi:ORF51 [White spot syndrome virus]|uniref:Wsv060 n=3 Tax=White spot syndrome virus TaxID=342409 RepID=Q77J92_WSSVS|nr:wsv060 [Shrimp white spot syndrome virus]AAK77720.1 ORF51 [White spot syndrome virus]AAL33064.1 wsv060 [Shrimp white spot syndrome virus]AAL88985.1 WSSV117 [Shrimp white spot syndrome virus]AFX59438.1 wsv060 [White spot syndrome virus]ASV62955.1 hypothetical protein [White spot syndrome virus]